MRFLSVLEHIQYFPVHDMGSLISINVDFRSSKLDCHCSLSWIKNPPSWLTVADVTDDNEYCVSPPNFTDVKWTEFTFDNFEVCPTTGQLWCYIVPCFSMGNSLIHNSLSYFYLVIDPICPIPNVVQWISSEYRQAMFSTTLSKRTRSHL